SRRAALEPRPQSVRAPPAPCRASDTRPPRPRPPPVPSVLPRPCRQAGSARRNPASRKAVCVATDSRPASCRLFPCQPLAQVFPQHHRLITIAVPCAVDEDDRTLPTPGEAALHRILGLGHFGAIAVCEGIPLVGIVAEPLAQRAARREILHPFVELQCVLADTPRPEAVDQQPRAPSRAKVVVDPGELDVRRLRHSAVSPIIRSSALMEWAKDAPARISAATQIASMICWPLAPARRAALHDPRCTRGIA